MENKNLKNAKVLLGISDTNEFVELFSFGSIKEGSIIILPNSTHKSEPLNVISGMLPTKTNRLLKGKLGLSTGMEISSPKIHFHKSGVVSAKSQKIASQEVRQGFSPLLDYRGDQFLSVTITNPTLLPRVTRPKDHAMIYFQKSSFPKVIAIAGFIQNIKNIRELNDFVEVSPYGGFISNGKGELAITNFYLGDDQFILTFATLVLPVGENFDHETTSLGILCLDKHGPCQSAIRSIGLGTKDHKYSGYLLAGSGNSPLRKIGIPSATRDIKQVIRKIADCYTQRLKN